MKETILHNFEEGTDGGFPTSTLVFDSVRESLRNDFDGRVSGVRLRDGI